VSINQSGLGNKIAIAIGILQTTTYGVSIVCRVSRLLAAFYAKYSPSNQPRKYLAKLPAIR